MGDASVAVEYLAMFLVREGQYNAEVECFLEGL